MTLNAGTIHIVAIQNWFKLWFLYVIFINNPYKEDTKTKKKRQLFDPATYIRQSLRPHAAFWYSSTRLMHLVAIYKLLLLYYNLITWNLKTIRPILANIITSTHHLSTVRLLSIIWISKIDKNPHKGSTDFLINYCISSRKKRGIFKIYFFIKTSLLLFI